MDVMRYHDIGSQTEIQK